MERALLHLRDRPILLVDDPLDTAQFRGQSLNIVERALLDDLQDQLNHKESLDEKLIRHPSNRIGEAT